MLRTKRLDVETLWKLERVGNVSVAPDGHAAVCAVTSYSMEDNKGAASLWVLPTDGAQPRRLTRCGEKDGRPAWSPKGDCVAFVAKREQEGRKDGQGQLYLIDSRGGEAERKTHFAPGVEDFKWMPDGRRIVFVSWVWPEARGMREQERRFKALEERKESAYITSEAQYRHFDKNLPMGRVPHLLLLDLDTGRIRDLFEGSSYALPLVEPGAAHFDISPDGRRIAFVHDPARIKRSTNPLVVAELSIATRRVTVIADDKGWSYDTPCYSPDGGRLACSAANVGRRHTALSQLALIERGGRPRVVGRQWDLDVEGALRWSRDGGSVYFAAQQRGRCHLWRCDTRSRGLTRAVRGGWIQGFDVGGAPGADTVVVVGDGASHPAQVHAVRAGRARRIDRFNDAILNGVALGETREVVFRGALGDPVQMFLTFPPRFDPKRKYPVLQVIHGGPFAAAGDTFGYRWNAHAFAAQGYVVASVNYHGSSGFGFAFRDSIMGRQGQLETRDVESGTNWLLRKPWVDRRRLFASGGSYGGFLVAWMNGHLPPGRYRAYICHAGVFDRLLTFSADSYAQRPLDLHALYWRNPARVRAQSPSTWAHRMRTPTLVIHGNNDYRVPDANGLAYYNTLQSRGVAARLVWFPDENHWVLKPRNSRLWYREFFSWLRAHDLPRRRG